MMLPPAHAEQSASQCRVTSTVATIRTAAIPQLVADLDGLDSGYRGVQPCITALLARVALIDQNVIAIPSSAAVRSCWRDGVYFMITSCMRLLRGVTVTPRPDHLLTVLASNQGITSTTHSNH